MKQFRSLTCTGDWSKQLSLCLLPAYLDDHPLPEEIGSLTLVELVAHKAVVRLATTSHKISELDSRDCS